MLRLILIAAIAVSLAVGAAKFQDTAALKADAPELDRMKLAELRHHLRRLGMDNCDDCVEKDHFRQRLKAALASGAQVQATAEEAEAKPRTRHEGTVNRDTGDASTNPIGEDELAGIRDMLRKKKEENDKMKETLRKAGIDPSSIRTEDDQWADILNRGAGGGVGGDSSGSGAGKKKGGGRPKRHQATGNMGGYKRAPPKRDRGGGADEL